MNNKYNKPRSVDDLNFTSRDSVGRITWWDVAPPKTNYWSAHRELGRAYGLELLKLLDNEDKSEELYEHAFSCIASDIARKSPGMMDGLYMGFFEVISERLVGKR